MQKNVAGIERLASVLLGGLSLTQSLKSDRNAATRTAAGGLGLALMWRGVTGNCPAYSAMDFKTYTGPEQSNGPALLERSTLVNVPIEEARSFLEMEETPYGLFDSGDKDNEFQIDLDDRTWILTLSAHADSARTLIKATWIDHPTAPEEPRAQGFLDRINPLKQKEPRILELRKLKSLMETGEIASIEGQPHGERSAFGTFVENFGDFLLHTIQSKTALPTDDSHRSSNALNEGANPSRSSLTREVQA